MNTPANYSLSDLSEGLIDRFTFTATSEMMKSFAEISGDKNPIHTDSTFAKSKGFGGVLVYGGILIAQVSRMIGMHLPGRNALWSSLNISFAHPMLIGQEAELEAKVVHVSESTSFIKLEFKIISNEKILAKGSAGVKVVNHSID